MQCCNFQVQMDIVPASIFILIPLKSLFLVFLAFCCSMSVTNGLCGFDGLAFRGVGVGRGDGAALTASAGGAATPAALAVAAADAGGVGLNI